MDAFIQERMKESVIPGVSIMKMCRGNAAEYRGYGVLEKEKRSPVAQDSVFAACSISKMITAVGILKLVQEKRVLLDENVNQYINGWQLEEDRALHSDAVNIRNILAHQAGFMDDEHGFIPYEEGTLYPDTLALLEGKTKYNAKQVKVEFVPESRFEYSDSGYCIIQKIIEDVTGEAFSKAMQHLVFEPLGLKDTFFATNHDLAEMKQNSCFAAGYDENGNVIPGKKAVFPHQAASGLWTTPKELLMIVADLMAAWNNDTGKLLTRGIVKDMMKPINDTATWAGMGVFLEGDAFVSKGWDTGYQCMLKAYPQEESAIVVMTNCDPGVEQNESLIGEIIRFFEDEINL